jgi:mono/diheme cytochrome c family protein
MIKGALRNVLSFASVGAVAWLYGSIALAQSPVERGAYLVNTVMTCQNCHTPIGPNGPMFDKALSGGLTFDEPPFKVTASNITPDPETGIGKWSDADLKKALRAGVRPNGIPFAPVMPTGFYEILTDADLDAIVAYLQAVKPIKNQVPPPDYKMAVQRQVFPGAEKPMPASAMSDPVKHGFYLATIAHCMECHTPMDKGATLFDSALGVGGREFPGPWGVSVSRNITSDKDKGIGAWTNEEIKRAITKGVRRDGSPLKPPMGFPYYAQMTEADLNDMIAYLRTVPPKQ